MRTPEWEVVVVGAGAAGLLAATRVAERGRRTLLLEKKPPAGHQDLYDRWHALQLTHACYRRGIVREFGPAGHFLHSALAVLSPAELIEPPVSWKKVEARTAVCVRRSAVTDNLSKLPLFAPV
ncbi:MAG TPA: FAD-dependent oxidoreductase [Pirellulales bacterium]|nr:FAD-dependent oxidoreductase [Pirellulales bacterium]